MKRHGSITVLAAVLASASLLTTGCALFQGKPRACPVSPVPPGLAIAVGDRTGSPQPSWPVQLDEQLQQVITTTEYDTGRHQSATTGITFVRVDGRPSVGCVMTFDASAANPGAEKDARNGFTESVQHEVRTLAAARPEADELTALSQAGAAAGPRGTVVLIDSGLQTVAPLNFAKAHLLDADINAVVAKLRAAGELPHLQGQTVILDGIGDTVAPQAALDQSQRDHLVGLWQQIAYAAGAKHVQVITAPATGTGQGGLPPVSPVPVPPPDNVTLGCDQESVLPDDGAVGFLPNSKTFRDPGGAHTVLARIAGWLNQHPAAGVSLTGSIAHYNQGVPGGLARSRAEAIRSALIRLGASPGRITAAGAGWGPYPTKTAPPDPVSDPLNRRVVVRFSCD